MRAWRSTFAWSAALTLLLQAAGATAKADEIVPPRLQEGQDVTVDYPEGIEREATASVVLQLLVDREGRVGETKPVQVDIEPKATDAAPFLAKAEAKARTLKFEPARRGNEPVPALIKFAFRVRPEQAAEQQFPDAEALPTPTEAPSSYSPAPAPAPAKVTSAPAPAPDSAPVPAPEAAPVPAPSFSAHANTLLGAGSPSPSAASDIHLELGALRSIPRRTAQDYLSLAPGLVLSNHAGIGHAAGVFMRGFDAGEGQDLELTVDGIPINEPSNPHAHGYADTQFVIPEVVTSLRVLEGPFDPRQGDFAVAGSAAYELGVDERGIRTRLGYGNFDEKRALLLWAPEGADRGTFAAVDLRQGDGFGPNRAHSSMSALARYAGGSGPLSYSLLLGSHALDFDSAGVLREDAFRLRELPCDRDEDSQFFCVADPNQGGSAARHLVSGKLEWRRPDRGYQLQGYGMLRNLRMRENFTGALLDPRGDGLDEGYETTAVGMHAAYALTPELWNVRQRLEIGIDARHDTGETRSWRLRRETGIPYSTVFDRDIALTHVGVYVRGELNYQRYVSLLGGARLDGFAFHTVNEAAPASDRAGERLPADARDAFGSAVSPRGSLVFHLLPELDWTISGGLGVRSSDAEALSEGEDAPFARALSLETGPTARGQFGDVNLEARAFGFATRVDQDLSFDPNRGRNVPIGPSNRYGASASARARVADAHDTLLSFTWTEAHQISRSDGIFDLGAGPRLPFVPRFVARLDHASNFHLPIGEEDLQLGAAAGISWIGPQPLPLKTESQARFQIDLSVRARMRFLELGLSVENLFDRRNTAAEFNYASFFGEDGDPVSMRAVRHFAAGTPRLWMLTLTAYFDDVAASGAGDSK